MHLGSPVEKIDDSDIIIQAVSSAGDYRLDSSISPAAGHIADRITLAAQELIDGIALNIASTITTGLIIAQRTDKAAAINTAGRIGEIQAVTGRIAITITISAISMTAAIVQSEIKLDSLMRDDIDTRDVIIIAKLASDDAIRPNKSIPYGIITIIISPVGDLIRKTRRATGDNSISDRAAILIKDKTMDGAGAISITIIDEPVAVIILAVGAEIEDLLAAELAFLLELIDALISGVAAGGYRAVILVDQEKLIRVIAAAIRISVPVGVFIPIIDDRASAADARDSAPRALARMEHRTVGDTQVAAAVIVEIKKCVAIIIKPLLNPGKIIHAHPGLAGIAVAAALRAVAVPSVDESVAVIIIMVCAVGLYSAADISGVRDVQVAGIIMRVDRPEAAALEGAVAIIEKLIAGAVRIAPIGQAITVIIKPVGAIGFGAANCIAGQDATVVRVGGPGSAATVVVVTTVEVFRVAESDLENRAVP